MSEFMFFAISKICIAYKVSMDELPKGILDEARLMDHISGGRGFANWANYRIYSHSLLIRSKQWVEENKDEDPICFVDINDMDDVVSEMQCYEIEQIHAPSWVSEEYFMEEYRELNANVNKS
jgi:hypothetical protein